MRRPQPRRTHYNEEREAPRLVAAMPRATLDGQECPKTIGERCRPVRSVRVRLKTVPVRGLVQQRQIREHPRTMLRVPVDRPITMLADQSLRGRERKIITLGREPITTTLGREPITTTLDRERLGLELRTTPLQHAAKQYRAPEHRGTTHGQKQLRAPELLTISQDVDRQRLDPEPRITILHPGSLVRRRTTAPIVEFRVRLLGNRTSRKDGQVT